MRESVFAAPHVCLGCGITHLDHSEICASGVSTPLEGFSLCGPCKTKEDCALLHMQLYYTPDQIEQLHEHMRTGYHARQQQFPDYNFQRPAIIQLFDQLGYNMQLESSCVLLQ